MFLKIYLVTVAISILFYLIFVVRVGVAYFSYVTKELRKKISKTHHSRVPFKTFFILLIPFLNVIFTCIAMTASENIIYNAIWKYIDELNIE